MNDTLLALFSWQLLLFSLCVFFIVSMLRMMVGWFWTTSENSMIWREITLRFLPCLIGATIGHFVSSYPYPLGISSVAAREIFGLVSGGLATLIFASVKGMVTGYLRNVANEILPNNGRPSPPDPQHMMSENKNTHE